jgi:uridine kinase
MYYAMIWPRLLLAPVLPAAAGAVTPLHLLAARLPLLVADAAILWLLVRPLGVPLARTLVLWWASPLVLYVTYVHGQLDLIPTAILLASLVLLDRDRANVSALVLGLGLATKTHLLVALPFMALYAARRARRPAAGVLFAAIAVIVYVAAALPWALDPAFRAMVFGSEEQRRLFVVGVDYKDGLRLLLAPLAVWLLLLRFVAQERPTRDTLFMFLGLAYTVMIALLPAAHGYYLWPLPFVVYFFAARVRDSLAPVWALNLIGVAYLALGRESTLAESVAVVVPVAAAWPAPLASVAVATGMDVAVLDSLLFTLLQGAVLVVALMMYRHGVAARIIERERRRPTLVGLGGDSGAGKHVARDVIADVIGGDRILTVDGDDVHRWGRGDPMWKVVSHLSPAGNDLYLQLRHAEALSDGRVVSKVSYDHATGRFTDPREVSPRDFVLFVGLHPFYLRRMRELLDVKIFMDTDERLRQAWKVARDVRARGYTEGAVREQIARRTPSVTSSRSATSRTS